MTPATTTPPRIARSQTREQQVVQLLTDRQERLTVGEIAKALLTERENVRSAVMRLHGRGKIQRDADWVTYHVGNSVAKHLTARWYVG